MRAVWSFWTKPMQTGRFMWPRELDLWLSWLLSVETARQHYTDTVLVTDRMGARILVDELGLPFKEVHTDLDALSDVDPSWWAVGKLFAYRMQRTPFIHVDSDVYLWKRLPAIVENAPVLAQSPERFSDHEHYQPTRLHERFVRNGLSVPAPWTWYLRLGRQIAACCGIVGGWDTDLLRWYAELAIDLALNPRHRPVWRGENVQRHMILIEQYLLSACVEYRGAHQASGRESYLQYLFPSVNFHDVMDVGYTHVIANAKRSRQVLTRMEEVARRDYAEQYRRCVSYSQQRVFPEDRSMSL